MQNITKLQEDIRLAQTIVGGSYRNLDTTNSYHENSFIYRFSNEDITNYQKYLENREKILSVTASGDQILNSILLGTKQVDSYDISRFPKYFFELKKAAVLALSQKDFLTFFLKEEDSDDLYDEIRKYLEDSNKKFWDSLFQFFEASELYNSTLFSHEVLTSSAIVNKNPYLQGDNYNILKDKLKNVEINHNVKDLSKMDFSKITKVYDLVNLSSIIYYSFEKYHDYKKLVESIPLSDNGVVVTYLYHVREDIIRNFSEKNYSFDNCCQGAMTYKK